MSLGNILNVGIGLFFTYLILSLLGTAVHEAAASVSLMRGRMLRQGLRQLLSDGVPTQQAALFNKVFGHGLVQSLSKSGLPSYLPTASFSLALFDALSDKSESTLFSQIERGVALLPPGFAKQTLTTFLVDAGGDLDAVRKRVDSWFDDSMDRLSGVYRRRSQLIHFLFGFLVAIVFNVDSINIANVLWHNTDARDAVALQAQSFVTTHTAVDNGATPDVSQALQELQRLPVPMGWTGAAAKRAAGDWVYAVVGWLVTGFAISLGAPFWFDLLQKIVNIRGAGPKPPPQSRAAAE